MKPNWNDAPAGANVCADGYWFKIAESYLLQWDDYEWVHTDYLNLGELAVDYVDIQLKEEPTMTASDFLGAALSHMEDRASTYDNPTGERSMGRTIEAFNAITGHKLTEEHGWLFMCLLKQVRSQQGKYKSDNYEDLTAYASLMGECAAKVRG